LFFKAIFLAKSAKLLSNLSAQCPSGHNTFTGAINNEWNTATNWSSGCVPVSPITGFISIEANCVLNGTASYTFNTGSTFQIKAGNSFTNNSSGTWTMNGISRGGGSYIGNATLSGAIRPGYITPPAVAANSGSVTHGGQTYATKLMPDGRWWMAENLNIGTMINGDINMSNNSIIEKYCYNNDAANCNTYGGLYQWSEMMQYTTTAGKRGICPVGWHLPTDAEWTSLKNSVPSTDRLTRLAGNASLWNNSTFTQNPYFGKSGFDAIPTGYYFFYEFRCSGCVYFWSSTRSGSENAISRVFYSDDLFQDYLSRSYGYAVRCIQD
jgi:uncharacterized protein (TIGR02145 family)